MAISWIVVRLGRMNDFHSRPCPFGTAVKANKSDELPQSKPLIHFPSKAYKAFKTFLALSFLATSTIYLLLITNHLFYGRTFLVDTGFWIGLSTGENPGQLIEPSSINANLESYYNTHYSPIYSALQIIYIPFKTLIPPATISCSDSACFTC